MLQRLAVALAQVKPGNTSENFLNESGKSYNSCIQQTKLLKRHIAV